LIECTFITRFPYTSTLILLKSQWTDTPILSFCWFISYFWLLLVTFHWWHSKKIHNEDSILWLQRLYIKIIEQPLTMRFSSVRTVSCINLQTNVEVFCFYRLGSKF
jgi:hypothetical protein